MNIEEVEIEFLEWVHPQLGVMPAKVEGDKPLVLKAKIKVPELKMDSEPDDLTIAYMSGYQDGKKKRIFLELNEKEIDIGLTKTNYALSTAQVWREGVEWATKQLKEKNA